MLGDRQQVERQLQLRPLLELVQRRDLGGELVVDDDGAAVAGAVDPVDGAVQAPAAEIEHRPLGVGVLAEARLQQPGLEAARVAFGLLGEEALQQPFDPARHRPLGRVVAEFALGDDLPQQRAAALGPGGEGVGPGEGVAGRSLAEEAVERLVHQPALDQRVGDRVEQLWVELVPGEPAVGADVELLQGGAAVGGDLGERVERRGVAQRPRSARGRLGAAGAGDPGGDLRRQLRFDPDLGQQSRRVGSGPMGRQRPRQLVR